MELQRPSENQNISIKDITAGRPGWVVRTESFFVRNKDIITLTQAGMFVLFMMLLFLPLFLSEPGEHDTPLDHFTVLANYLIWGLWFPLVFLSVIFSGRSWCGLLCPMGAASEWVNKRGLQRKIPAWLRWEGTPILSFIIITMLGQTVGVRDHPEAIAEVFGGTMIAAIVIGYVYGKNKRAWCRHACPIGLLLGIFSRIGAIQFSPKRPKTGCQTYSEKGVCPTLINTSYKDESRHCIECFRCVSPKAKGGLALLTRRPGVEVENIRDHNPNRAEIWFFFLATGTALGGFLWLVSPLYQEWRMRLATWFVGQEYYWIGDAGPWWLMSVHPERREMFTWLDFIMIVGWMSLCAIALASVLWLTTWLSAWLAGKQGADRNHSQRFIELGYQYAPIAMVSLIVGLGSELFEPIRHFGIGSQGIGFVKASLFVVSLFWSMLLGYKILGRQQLAVSRRWIALAPGLLGSIIVALCWWPALFGA